MYVSATSIKCYSCGNTGDENCFSGEKACGSSGSYCMKKVTSGAVVKDCAAASFCSNEKAECNSNSDCQYFGCCQKDLCNASTNAKSTSMVIAVTTLAALARGFLM